MLLSYMRVNGVEISNGDRFKAHMDNGLGQGIRVHDCGCGTVTYPDAGPYVLPHTSTATAPWYDSNRPESAHFAGVLIDEVLGLDDPYEARTVDVATLGGSLGSLRLGPRQLVVKATLFALSTTALDYGLEWLTAVLSGRHCNADTFANLGDVQFFSTCPDAAQGSQCADGMDADHTVPVIDETNLDVVRTMYGSGLVSGPRVVDRMARGRQTVAYQVTWTIGMESPYLAGSLSSIASEVDLDANAAVSADVFSCPGFVDPCPPSTQFPEIPPYNEKACVSYVEDTCDWNNGSSSGPNSWATQTWTATGEEVVTADNDCSAMTLTRTGNAAIDGCTRPSVRMLFADATGGEGPISVEFTYTEAQGNINFALWNPATDENIPIISFESPSGSKARVKATRTGDSYHIPDTTALGVNKIYFDVDATTTDPGSLYFIISAFGGGYTGDPENETVTNIRMNYIVPGQAGGGDPGDPDCCSLDPGVPIVEPTFSVPCYTAPLLEHRNAWTVANADEVLEMGMAFAFTNNDPIETAKNIRVAIYDTTLIEGLGNELPPMTATTWSLGGVAEWECAALIHEFYLPELPANSVVEIDGLRRRALRYPIGSPEAARSGSRFVYGGDLTPWNYQTVPPCKTYAVAVFADESETPADTTVTLSVAPLHLIDGAAT